jgi:cytochrome c-type protein NapB
MNDANPSNKEVVKPMIDEESIGLRKIDLYTEDSVLPSATQYSDSIPGSGKKFQRAFQDAPPMIPHDTTGMLPIKIDNNQCISCHTPGVAESMNALPYPKSHTTNFRPTHKYDGKKFEKSIDNMKNEISIKELDELANARFNCSACHAPQSEGQLVENNFVAEFTSLDGNERSMWMDEKFTEGLDTLKD